MKLKFVIVIWADKRTRNLRWKEERMGFGVVYVGIRRCLGWRRKTQQAMNWFKLRCGNVLLLTLTLTARQQLERDQRVALRPSPYRQLLNTGPYHILLLDHL